MLLHKHKLSALWCLLRPTHALHFGQSVAWIVLTGRTSSSIEAATWAVFLAMRPGVQSWPLMRHRWFGLIAVAMVVRITGCANGLMGKNLVDYLARANCPFPPGGCIFSSSWKSSTHPQKLEQTHSQHSSKRTLLCILTDFCWLLKKTFKTTLKAQSISNCSQK